MCGSKTYLVVFLCNAVLNAGDVKTMIFHSIIHHQVRVCKVLNVKEIVGSFVKIANYIRSYSIKHHQFKNFRIDILS